MVNGPAELCPSHVHPRFSRCRLVHLPMIKTVLAKVLPLGVVAVLLIAMALPAAAQFEQFEAEDCLSNRALQSAIASGEIPPVSDVLDAQGVDPDDVLSVKVCQGRGGALSYFVGVLNPYGEASTLVLPADGDRQ